MVKHLNSRWNWSRNLFTTRNLCWLQTGGWTPWK